MWGAFYTFPNVIKSGFSGNEFTKKALEDCGVALVPGKSFGESGKNFVRISYTNSIENIENAINRLSVI